MRHPEFNSGSTTMSYIYIMASTKNGTLYVGSTTDLVKRVKYHRQNVKSRFTNRYKVNILVYFEKVFNIIEARKKERQLKMWHRDWKIELVEKNNPDWKDLYPELIAKI